MGNNRICVAGEFVAPAPAINSYQYEDVSSCPQFGQDFTRVVSQPCGKCIEGSSYYTFNACTTSYIYVDYYSDETCSGTREDTYSGVTGCVVFQTQVSINECAQSSNETGKLLQRAPGDMKASHTAKLLLNEAQEMPVKYRAGQLAIESAIKEGVAQDERDLAAAFASL